MRFAKSARFVLTLTVALSTLGWIACTKRDGEVAAAASEVAKIPITTKSDEAKNEFLLGRDLSERLLGQESLQHFDKAIALDPDLPPRNWRWPIMRPRPRISSIIKRKRWPLPTRLRRARSFSFSRMKPGLTAT